MLSALFFAGGVAQFTATEWDALGYTHGFIVPTDGDVALGNCVKALSLLDVAEVKAYRYGTVEFSHDYGSRDFGSATPDDMANWNADQYETWRVERESHHLTHHRVDLQNHPATCFVELMASVTDIIVGNSAGFQPDWLYVFESALYWPVGVFKRNAENARTQRDECTTRLRADQAQSAAPAGTAQALSACQAEVVSLAGEVDARGEKLASLEADLDACKVTSNPGENLNAEEEPTEKETSRASEEFDGKEDMEVEEIAAPKRKTDQKPTKN